MRIAPANLEVFKFGLYVFFPVAILVRYGDPEWYQTHVLPYRAKMFPPEDRLTTKLPTDQTQLREELDRIKARKLERKIEREHQEKEV